MQQDTLDQQLTSTKQLLDIEDGPRYGSGDYSPDYHQKGTYSIPGQCTWNFKRIEWQWDRFSSDNLRFPPSVIIQPMPNSQSSKHYSAVYRRLKKQGNVRAQHNCVCVMLLVITSEMLGREKKPTVADLAGSVCITFVTSTTLKCLSSDIVW